MLRYNKQRDLADVFRFIVNNDSLIRGIFLDNSDLEHFYYACTSEYDDNNYSTYTRLTHVNGHPVDYNWNYVGEEEYEGEYEKDDSNLPLMNKNVVAALADIVDRIGAEYGYNEQHEIKREDYSDAKRIKDKVAYRYLKSYFGNEKIEDEWFLKNEPKWAAYYAEENGRFSKEMETQIFCKAGFMQEAFMYAQALNRSLPSHIEDFFMTHSVLGTMDERDLVWFKEYSKFKKELSEKTSKKKVNK